MSVIATGLIPAWISNKVHARPYYEHFQLHKQLKLASMDSPSLEFVSSQILSWLANLHTMEIQTPNS